jgi:hypothetical protein
VAVRLAPFLRGQVGMLHGVHRSGKSAILSSATTERDERGLSLPLRIGYMQAHPRGTVRRRLRGGFVAATR